MQLSIAKIKRCVILLILLGMVQLIHGCKKMKGDKMNIEDGKTIGSWSVDYPLHGKLTYIGAQEKPFPSVIFHLEQSSTDYGIFERHQNPSVDYSNDLVGNSKVFFFSRDEQAEILRKLGSIQIPHEISNASWAVVFVYCHPANEEGIEWLIDNNICRKIVLAIQGSLSNENESGKSILMRTLNITGG